MDVQLVAQILAFVPLIVVVAWFFRSGSLDAAAQARRVEMLREYAAARRLTLGGAPTVSGFSLSGSFDGMALAIDTPSIASGKARKTVTRIRLQLPEGGGDAYRGRAPGDERLVLARRGAGLALEAIAGLSEIGTGDAAFDSTFRGYAPNASAAPWSRPAIRAGLLALEGRDAWRVERIERAAGESTVVLAEPVCEPPAIDRAIQLAVALVDPSRAARVEPALARPIAWTDPPEVLRAAESSAPLGIGLFGSLMVCGPGLFLNPAVHALVELVACDDGWRLGTRSAGKGVSLVCRAASGRGVEGANLWGFLVSFGVHFLVIAAIVSVVRALRSDRQRS